MISNTIKEYTLLNRVKKLQNILDFTKGEVSKHIVKWYKEDDNKYDWRVQVSYYQNYITPIIDGLTGMIFSKSHLLNVDENYLTDIDLMGSSLFKFSQLLVKNAIRDGLCFIISDTNVTQKASLQDVQSNNLRGYLKMFEYSNLVNFRVNNGQLTQIVFKDSVMVDDDEDDFKTKNVDRYIRYTLDGGEIYHDNKGLKLIRRWSNSLDTIPISIVYGSYDNIGMDVESIIYNIVKLNKSHLNLKSGLMNISHIASNPTPIIWGEPSNTSNGTMSLGVNSVISFPTNQGKAYDFQWREISGSSVQVAEREIKALEDYIVSSSFNILRIDNFATATEARLNFNKNKSILTSIAKSLEDGLIKAFQDLEKLTDSKLLNEIKINDDFDNLALNAENITAVINLKNSGNISLETLWQTLIRGEVIQIDDFELEKERLKDELSTGL